MFIDESGLGSRPNRARARAPCGQRAHGTAPGGHGEWLTLVGAMRPGGICATMAWRPRARPCSGLLIEQVLIPALKRERPGAVVAMDSLAAHKAACVRKALEAAGINYRCTAC